VGRTTAALACVAAALLASCNSSSGQAAEPSCSIAASDYDRSCVKDSDCWGMAEGDLCAVECPNCVNAAINVRDEAKYLNDVSSKVGAQRFCPCPDVPVACNAGTCGLATFFPVPPADAAAGDAAADTGADGRAECVAAGGVCVVGDANVCALLGSQDCNPERAPGGSYCCLKLYSAAGTDGGVVDAGVE
jgi:hypothetical protein